MRNVEKLDSRPAFARRGLRGNDGMRLGAEIDASLFTARKRWRPCENPLPDYVNLFGR